MTLELLRAVKAASDCSALQDSCSQCHAPLRAALSATIAEFKKRREDGGRRNFAGPFVVQQESLSSFCVRSHSGIVISDRWPFAVSAEDIAAALNAFYGYGPNGEDWVKEMES